MITDKASYRYYLERDLRAYELRMFSFHNYCCMDALRFQRRLRKIEYLHNVCRKNVFCRVRLLCLKAMNHRLATRLGFSIPKNVFGA